MGTTNAWANLPRWHKLLAIIVCGVWYCNQLSHNWLLELLAMLVRLARLMPH